MRNGGDRLYRSFFFFLFEVQVGRTGRKSLRIFDIRQYIDTTSRILYNHILSAYVDLAIRERLCVYTSSNSSNTAAMRGRRRPASSTVYRAAARNPPSWYITCRDDLEITSVRRRLQSRPVRSTVLVVFYSAKSWLFYWSWFTSFKLTLTSFAHRKKNNLKVEKCRDNLTINYCQRRVRHLCACLLLFV